MENEVVLVAFYFGILLYSVIVHEVSHGWAALFLGDLTAKYAGRLNLNPMKHIDPLGSIIVPIAMFLTAGFAFGWAKPVPYNPYNLRNQKWGPAIVALAGPATNIVVALLAVLVAKLIPISALAKADIFNRFVGVLGGGDFIDKWGLFASALSGSFENIFFGLAVMVIFWNVLLAFFNLIPVPPLDGSKLLFSLFNLRPETVEFLEQWGLLMLIFVILFFSYPIAAILNFALGLFFGMIV